MPNPDTYYGVNTIPAVAWALDLYREHGGRLKDQRVVELILPAGQHKQMMRSLGNHEIAVWLSDNTVWVRARCTHSKNCRTNSERIDGRDRERLKALPWDETDQRAFFPAMRKWLMRLEPDFVLFVRALNTVCNRRVRLPLTTKYGKTFNEFNEYRSTRWPKDVTPQDKDRFLEALLLRVAFWIGAAAEVGALLAD